MWFLWVTPNDGPTLGGNISGRKVLRLSTSGLVYLENIYLLTTVTWSFVDCLDSRRCAFVHPLNLSTWTDPHLLSWVDVSHERPQGAWIQTLEVISWWTFQCTRMNRCLHIIKEYIYIYIYTIILVLHGVCGLQTMCPQYISLAKMACHFGSRISP